MKLEYMDSIFDFYMKTFITTWFWPYYVIGNLDDWQKLGITLNGAKPINLCQPQQTKKLQIQKP